jgi:hypothetical protein
MRCHAALIAVVATACSIVDSSHYQNLSRKEPVIVDSGPLDGEKSVDASPGPADAGPQLVQQCGTATPSLPQRESKFEVSTLSLRNQVDRSNGLTCVDDQDPVGNEGFLAVTMQSGDTWHFHVAPVRSGSEARDPSVYMLDGDSCDVRGDRSDEHFTFTAPRSATYYLGIDDRHPGGGTYTVDAIKVICGNGQPQHGKACDSGKTDDPRCDRQCRVVLDPDNPQETLVHDDFNLANVISFAGGANSISIAGTIGGCQRDYYTFDAKGGDRARITLLDRDQKCQGTGRVEVQLQRLNNSTIETQQVGAGQDCQSLLTDKLTEARYYIRLQDKMLVGGDAAPITYKLKVELNPP